MLRWQQKIQDTSVNIFSNFFMRFHQIKQEERFRNQRHAILNDSPAHPSQKTIKYTNKHFIYVTTEYESTTEQRLDANW